MSRPETRYFPATRNGRHTRPSRTTAIVRPLITKGDVTYTFAIVPTPPASTVDIAVPTGTRWRVHSINAEFLTDGNALNRQVMLREFANNAIPNLTWASPPSPNIGAASSPNIIFVENYSILESAFDNNIRVRIYKPSHVHAGGEFLNLLAFNPGGGALGPNDTFGRIIVKVTENVT